MQFTKQCKPEKCCSENFPMPWLVTKEGGRGEIYASNGFTIARLPVVLDDGDQAGVIPVEAFKAARKAKHGWAGRILLNGRADTGAGSFERIGELPKKQEMVDKVWPKSPITFEVGIDPEALYNLAQALGAVKVKLSFRGDTRTILPIEVTPVVPSYASENRGLIMPVRIKE